jgi:hypothetical protein
MAVIVILYSSTTNIGLGSKSKLLYPKLKSIELKLELKLVTIVYTLMRSQIVAL